MTQAAADEPSLPLMVTCTADADFGDTIVALARRMAGGEGAPAADRFATAVDRGVSTCLETLRGDETQTLSVELSSTPSHWQGDLRWPATDGSGRADASDALARVEAALTSLADVVECAHTTSGAHCRLRCRRA